VRAVDQVEHINQALQTYPILGQAVDRLRALTLQLNLATRPRYQWTESPDKSVAGGLARFNEEFTTLSGHLVKQMLLYGTVKLRVSTSPSDGLQVVKPTENLLPGGKILNFKFSEEPFLFQAIQLCEQRALLTDGSLLVAATKQTQDALKFLGAEIVKALKLHPDFFKPKAPFSSDRQLASKYPATWQVVKRLRVLVHKGFTRVCDLYLEHLGVEDYSFEVLVPPRRCT